MEGGDLHRAQSTARRGGGSWRETNVEGPFSRSMRDEDDEEALRWAAIERLPTYDRLRKGMLRREGGGASEEVDIGQLGLQERKELLERLVRVAEQHNESFLFKFKSRIDRVGIVLPTIEVRFDHLNVEAKGHIGSRALPTVFNFYVNVAEGILNFLHLLPSRKKQINILNDVSGVIKPSRLTLLLGPPSSGKTTLLLALAGKLDPKLKVSGKVTYNGHEMYEFVPQRNAAYISQHDLHLGEMTVRETLEFAARCQGIGHRYEMLTELLRREKEANIKPDPDIDVFMKAIATEGKEASVITDYYLKILGLDVCADIIVGNDMLRGISGGQKKRVTTGEMLVGPSKSLFMDEISTGLDSSTTYQIVNSIKQANHIFNGTAVISLLQPAPETYELFDDIILLSDGQIVYQGPREHVLEFFDFMGFKCPERKGVADFLQEVTSNKDQEQYWARRDEPYRFIPVKNFAKEFQSFHVGRSMSSRLSVPFNKAKSHPAALTTQKFGTGNWELLKACFCRELLLMKRNSFVYTFKLTQLAIMAMVAMTLFLRTHMHKSSVPDGGIFVGALFYSVIFIMFNGVAEISMTVMKLPVFYKQRDLLFFPSWAYSLPPMILKVPITLVEVGIWVSITYYVIGYDPSVGRFFKHYLLLAAVSQMSSSLFRFIAAAGRTMIVANTFGTFALLVLVAFSGFVLSHVNIKKWWVWGYWMSPLMYAQNAIVVNEFTSSSWSQIPPNSTVPLGVQVLKSRGFFTDPKWFWIGLGALAGFVVLFNFSYTMALIILKPFQKHQAVVSKNSSNKNEDANQITIHLSNQISSLQKCEEHSRSSMSRVQADDVANGNHHRRRGIILPFEPHSITFDEIFYSVDMPQEMKNQGVAEDKLVLLNGVSGSFRPGVLTALMGVSGAGKTTLMDVLAGRKTGGYIEGNITISGYLKKQETFARISGYCEQNDIHSPHVTVYESLVYSAWLRLPSELSNETRRRFVEEVMELVELTLLRQALVGLPGVSGLSTEQRKRLTIAVELVANPSIICMDEPTSGLDARAAAIVMRTVRNTVDTGRTVVCTIHQPSIDIFEAFDELFLLKRGGYELYVGPLGCYSSQLIEYFEGIEGVPTIKDGYNPATWMLEVTNATQESTFGVDFTEIYKNSALYRRNKALIKELSTPPPDLKELHFSTMYTQTFWTQYMACLWKQNLSYWRNPQYTAVRLLFTTIVALFVGTMFWRLGSKIEKRQDLFNAMGSMYAAMIFLGLQNVSAVQPVVAVERTVFYREKAAGMYSPLPYAMAQAFIELPYALVQALVYGFIVYSMVGLEWNVTKLLWYLFIVYFSLLYFTFYGMMAVAATPNQHIASILSLAIYSLWNIFSGFIIPRPKMPVWWRWYSWLSPVGWTLYGLVVSQFGDIEDRIETGETVKGFLRSYYGFENEFLVVVAFVVFAFAAVFAFTFTMSIKFFNFQRR